MVIQASHDPPPRTPPRPFPRRRHLDILKSPPTPVTVLSGSRLVEGPSTIRDRFASDDFADGYINVYVCNGVVVGASAASSAAHPDFSGPAA